MTDFGHKNLLTTQDKIGQICTLLSKPLVCQSLSRTPNPTHSLVPLPGQVWLQSSLCEP